jgi:hypothetical protein
MHINARMNVPALALALALVFSGCARHDQYEVIERTDRAVANFNSAGTHTEVGYVLLYEGHKIYATCDVADVSQLDPEATCGFRPLRKYQCRLGQQNGDNALSDLLCKDADGHNVYLYVSKKE